MIRWKQWGFVFASFFSSLLCAYVQPEPGHYGAEIEYLYFLPSFDDTYFVVVSDVGANPKGNRAQNAPDFQSAFRLKYLYNCSNYYFDFQLRWTHLKEDWERSISHPHLFTTLNFPGAFLTDNSTAFFANSKMNVQYDTVEALISLPSLCCDFVKLLVSAGLQYTYLTLKNNLLYLQQGGGPFFNQETDAYKVHSWGVGPEVALEGHYEIGDFDRWCWCQGTFSLVGLASASLLVGNNQAHFSDVSNSGNVDATVNDKKIWRAIPYVSFRLGANYEICFKCVAASLEIGYEFDYFYHYFSNVRLLNSFVTGISINAYSSFSLQGPYLSLGLTY